MINAGDLLVEAATLVRNRYSASIPDLGLKSLRRRIMRTLYRLLSLLAATTAHAQVHFTGQTTADVVLIKDVLGTIQLYGQSVTECASIESVSAELLPQWYLPPRPAPEGKNRARHEKWVVTMCQVPSTFLVTLWKPSGDDGITFAVSPFRPSK